MEQGRAEEKGSHAQVLGTQPGEGAQANPKQVVHQQKVQALGSEVDPAQFKQTHKRHV